MELLFRAIKLKASQYFRAISPSRNIATPSFYFYFHFQTRPELHQLEAEAQNFSKLSSIALFIFCSTFSCELTFETKEMAMKNGV